jgi:hypothetical protein
MLNKSNYEGGDSHQEDIMVHHENSYKDDAL